MHDKLIHAGIVVAVAASLACAYYTQKTEHEALQQYIKVHQCKLTETIPASSEYIATSSTSYSSGHTSTGSAIVFHAERRKYSCKDGSVIWKN